MGDYRDIDIKRERDSLQSQLSEARAQCERLRHAVNLATNNAMEDRADVWAKIRSILEETPAQSLNKIKAQAVEEACRASMPGPCGPPDDPPAGYQEFCEGVAAVADYAASLRQQGKEE